MSLPRHVARDIIDQCLGPRTKEGPLIRPRTHDLLEVGDRFKMHLDCRDPRTFEVLRVGPGSLTIRSTSHQQHVDFQTHAGAEVDFDRPGKRFQICRRPIGVIKVED